MYLINKDDVIKSIENMLGAEQATIFFGAGYDTQKFENGATGLISVATKSRGIGDRMVTLVEYARVLSDVPVVYDEESADLDGANLEYSEPYEYFLTIN